MRPFECICVLDFTHVYAGLFSTFQLVVMGADIIKMSKTMRQCLLSLAMTLTPSRH
jgi:crotonobetainyl-CoA:carnitine CoA-transferase CaiB-like acyl-CoA transferase